MQRVMIVGDAGAGKSTLAHWLGAQTGLPVHHLDQVFWMPDWQRRPEADKARIVAQTEAQERWIIEGGLAHSYATRLARADMVIWLDLGVMTRLWRLICRTWQYRGQRRPDLPEGCIERLGRSRAVFLYEVWKERGLSRREIQTVLEQGTGHAIMHHLRTPAAVRQFQAQLR